MEKVRKAAPIEEPVQANGPVNVWIDLSGVQWFQKGEGIVLELSPRSIPADMLHDWTADMMPELTQAQRNALVDEMVDQCIKASIMAMLSSRMKW